MQNFVGKMKNGNGSISLLPGEKVDCADHVCRKEQNNSRRPDEGLGRRKPDE